jgi:hypothetical protein
MDKNEPAFPGNFVNESGMSLRDYFAAKAMQAVIISTNGSSYSYQQPEKSAQTAYVYADAMLAAREA